METGTSSHIRKRAAHLGPERRRPEVLDAALELFLVGGYDHYEVVFEDGTCSTSDLIEREPNVTIRVAPIHFLKLAANQASGPTLFLTGKLRLEGDVMLASRLTSFFRIPTAA